ncbi:hypothetical protein V5O48_011495 [Marasmius crinis-equi]|uniref:Amidohydrolase 3 domain-containing protein n=1 Tax=Marasmius crinis-equi TaxID=585013 RepID=A0ABR3F5Q1_9AGAR
MPSEKKPQPPSPKPKPRISPKLGLTFVSLSILLFSAFRHWHREEEYIICSKSNNIYTVDASGSKPRVECIGVRGEEILEVGGLADVTSKFESTSSGWSWIDNLGLPSLVTSIIHTHLKPKITPKYIDPAYILVPGLSDAHAHIIENGFKSQLSLDTASSIDEIVSLVKAYILARPGLSEDEWIEGMGWNQERWTGEEARFPTAADLSASRDPILKNRLIALRRVDGHATWVSPRVLEITPTTKDDEVEGGVIVRDDEGKATGVFLDNAINLIPLPTWSDAKLEEYFDITMAQALQYGLTSVHDADTLPHMREFFVKQAEAGKIPIRLYIMLNGHSEAPKNGQLTNYGKHGRLTMRAIKLYTDGALGSWGAALLEPYTDNPSTRGIMRNTKEEMKELVRRYWEEGWQVNIHCIGDRANHVVLDVWEGILHNNTHNDDTRLSNTRPRIEHAQIMTQGDLARAGDLGDRIKGAYAYKTQLHNSPQHVLPLGSDFPVEGVNPLLGFYAAVSRLSPDGSSPHGDGGWYPSERLTRAEALKGMTLDAAYASFTENTHGSLEAGKKAEFVVLDRDIMTVPFREILETKVRATVVDGKVVYGGI